MTNACAFWDDRSSFFFFFPAVDVEICCEKGAVFVLIRVCGESWEGRVGDVGRERCLCIVAFDCLNHLVLGSR